jgi:hypothetical protein
VPVPVPMGSDASAASSLFAQAGGLDMYQAFLSSAGYARMPPAPVAQPPPGFVPPPGFKLVPAPGPAPGVGPEPGYLWPSSVNRGRDDAHHRQNPHAGLDLDNTRQPKEPNQGDQGKLFVGGLSPATSVEMLKEHFSRFGKLVEASVIKDPVTKLSRGFGFVEFEGSIPTRILKADHIIDKRKCGVRPYTY